MASQQRTLQRAGGEWCRRWVRLGLFVLVLTQLPSGVARGMPSPTDSAEAQDTAREWTYARLTQQADFIAIAEVQETRNAKKPAIPDRILNHLGVEVLTAMKPLTILKGSKDLKELSLRHFKMKARLAHTPSPRFLKLRTGRRYVVFLKKANGGDFRPASGQFNSFHSAKLISE